MSTDKTTPLILITGHPCTGKTTLGLRLAADLRLPFINKDGIKEQLFESLGWSDREASRRLAPTTFALLYYFLTAQLRAGQPCIIEANFDPAFATEEFHTRQHNFPLRIFQLLCYADGQILFERFQLRSESGERHPGHQDHLAYDEWRTRLSNGRLEPLQLDGTLYELDTSDFAAIDYKHILNTIRDFLVIS
ncbi:AAA family ATPase [Ktedonobacter robiniae]|uniref:ATP-binding protein n=1 Tax=Ktedonobacter robiniae TaxID=2778365 RepID=A0ABQ3UQ34_9CHLR|nr:AAA family ATPase [Ktedonobacter robiniae]GHO54707.1 hypothetical protein KSB_31820 [Ktedonobacter robiniae]